MKGKQLPSGRSGYYFAENGAQSWKDIAQAVGKVGKEAGSFDADGIHSIGLEVVAAEFYDGDLRDAEAVLASKYVSLLRYLILWLGKIHRSNALDFAVPTLTSYVLVQELRRIGLVKFWNGSQSMDNQHLTKKSKTFSKSQARVSYS